MHVSHGAGLIVYLTFANFTDATTGGVSLDAAALAPAFAGDRPAPRGPRGTVNSAAS